MFVRTRVALLCVVAACLRAADVSAWDLFLQGRVAERAGRMADAYVFYSQASAMEPRNQEYWARAFAVRSRAMLQARPLPKLEQTQEEVAEGEEEPAYEPATPQDL